MICVSAQVVREKRKREAYDVMPDPYFHHTHSLPDPGPGPVPYPYPYPAI